MSEAHAGAPGDDLLAETEDQAALRQLARDVADREVAPRAHQADEDGVVPAEVRKALAAADLLRITVGEQWGGMGLGDVEASIVLEEIARADVSVGHLLPADLQRAAAGHRAPRARTP